MSSCSCDTPNELRVSDEGIRKGVPRGDWGGLDESIDGVKSVRLRCRECGGKAGYAPLPLLEHLAPDVDIEQCAEPGEIYPTLLISLEYGGSHAETEDEKRDYVPRENIDPVEPEIRE